MSISTPEWLLEKLHYACPAAIFLYFVIASTVAACTLQTSSSAAMVSHKRSGTIVLLLLLLLVSYLAQLVVKGIEHLVSSTWPKPDTVVGLLSSVLVFGIQQGQLGKASGVVWFPFYGSWFLALVFEPLIAVLDIIVEAQKHQQNSSIFLWTTIFIATARFVVLLTTVLVYFLLRGKVEQDRLDDERSPLIPKPGQRPAGGSCSADSGYGTSSEGNTEASNTDATNSPSEAESPWERQQREAREKIEKRLKSEGSWIAYAKGFLVFFPYVWPVKNRRLQLHAALVGVCLLAGNALNLLVPRQLGIVMDALGDPVGKNPWTQVAIFAILKLAASEAGINLVRNMLWLPVEYYSMEALSMAAYSHVMNLSSDFHDAKSSSDLIVAISHGNSISNMLESICFEAVPSLIDLAVAFVYLSAKFGAYEGFITMATAMAFFQAASYIIARFQGKRKEMVKTYYEEHYIRQAGIEGWHTVSAFNQIPYEESRYKTAITAKVSSLQKLFSGYLVGNAFQYLVLLCGMLAGSFLAVYKVVNGPRTAGDFVMFLTYWGQLTTPLHFFASLGKSISQDLVYAERLLEVMLAKPSIADKPNAKPLNLKGGKIDFRKVDFSYDKKKDILKSVSLTVPQGKTAAFVGATGAGKSTILKLLDRFYDVTGGSILVDGQDIRDIQLSSLRQQVGIVPQSPILFDDTIISNIRYARQSATDEEIYEACKAAAIHDHIMGFSEGYKTRVGERGVKLSGGELQRIAIARAILKRPEIVLLDEATSSVDTETEQKIQDGLRILCEGRTTLIVAHRLSTVMNADIIFVICDGGVAEQGNHEELLKKEGRYSDLWSKQIFVKPKELKETSATEATEDPSRLDGAGQQPHPSSSNGAESTDTSKDQVPVTSTQHAVATPPQRPVTTPKLDMNMVASKATEQTDKATDRTGKASSGHKKEGSKLNPGAAEFTPRSRVASIGPLPSSACCDWAEDAQSAANMESHTVTASIFDVTTAYVHDHTTTSDDTNTTEEAQRSPIAQAAVCYRLHESSQDAMRSVSDPVPEQSPKSPASPTRAPTPTKSEPAQPKMVLRTNTNEAETTQDSHTPPESGSCQPDNASRGRGRGGRGRSGQRGFHGRGRGRRPTTNDSPKRAPAARQKRPLTTG